MRKLLAMAALAVVVTLFAPSLLAMAFGAEVLPAPLSNAISCVADSLPPGWLVYASLVNMIASLVCAVTPTPAPGTPMSYIYAVLELLAANFGHAKDPGGASASPAASASAAGVNPAQPTASAAPAGSVAAPVIALLIAAGLMLSACSTVQAPEKTLIASCNGYAVALNGLAQQKELGNLSAATVATVDKINSAVAVVCDPTKPIPTDSASAIDLVDRETAQLVTILNTVK